MLYFDRIDGSETINVNRINALNKLNLLQNADLCGEY